MARKTIDQLNSVQTPLLDGSYLAIKQSGVTSKVTVAQLFEKLLSTNISGSERTISNLDSAVSTNANDIGALRTLLDGKVDKKDNKGLSTNDFTNEFKTKLELIDDNATANGVSDENAYNAKNSLLNSTQYAKLKAIGSTGTLSANYAANGGTAQGSTARNGLMTKAQAARLEQLDPEILNNQAINYREIGVGNQILSADSNHVRFDIATTDSAHLAITPDTTNRKITFNAKWPKGFKVIKAGNNTLTAGIESTVEFVSSDTNHLVISGSNGNDGSTVNFNVKWPALATSTAPGLISSDYFKLLQSIYNIMGQTTSYHRFGTIKCNNTSGTLTNYTPVIGNSIVQFTGKGNTSITATQSSSQATTVLTVETHNKFGNEHIAYAALGDNTSIDIDDYDMFFFMVRVGTYDSKDNYIIITVPSVILKPDISTSAWSLINHFGADYDGFCRIDLAKASAQGVVTVRLVDARQRSTQASNAALWIYGMKH